MGGRYYLTGVQLGILKGHNETDCPAVTKPLVREILQKVEDEQFIGNIEVDEDRKAHFHIVFE